MKITPKILSIPPYLSTSWTQVRALYVKDTNLVVSLADGAVINIPALSAQDMEAIFDAHATFIENQQLRQPSGHEKQTPLHLFQAFGQSPNKPPVDRENSAGQLRFSFDNMDSLSSALHHNPSQGHLPDLPKEVLNKIAAIAKVVAPDDVQNMPKPEPHCNCPHCQIARAIHGKAEESLEEPKGELKEEDVSPEELHFQQWDIIQTGDNLYSVANRLDTQEKYNVYLGNPVGCTCGKSGCEHILAVLRG